MIHCAHLPKAWRAGVGGGDPLVFDAWPYVVSQVCSADRWHFTLLGVGFEVTCLSNWEELK